MKWKLYALDHLLDDHYALWDFGDGLPEFRPDHDETRIEELVELIKLDLVRITFGRWHLNETKPVKRDAAVAAVYDPKSWRPTDGAPGYVIKLTQAGYDTLRLHGIGGKKSS